MSVRAEIILLIRFSSFGDVVQTLSVVTALKQRWPEAEIHWITRSEFIPLIENHPHLHKVWGLNKTEGFIGLLHTAQILSHLSLTRIYDAHNNMRSWFLGFFLFWSHIFKAQRPPLLLRRSIRRWKRFLLFQLRINRFEQPFSGQRDLLEPLQAWGIDKNPPQAPQLFLGSKEQAKAKDLTVSFASFITMAPSAAFALKRWPMEHWQSLLRLVLMNFAETHVVLLGGPEDQFIQELVQIDPSRVHSFAGQLSLAESAAVIKRSRLLVANDTGLLHVGEQLGHSSIALMGPAPFGFPCRRETTKILELTLDCRPCSKHGQGPCRNSRFQWCMVGITPEWVFEEVQKKLQDPEVSLPC